MQIFVKTQGSTLTIDAAPSMTVAALKAAVEDLEFIPAELQSLVCGSRQLAVGTLADLGVEEADTVTLNLCVNGGMRAKWR
ncbi:unnamed protein product [Phaeothamnion confervicola]